MSMIPTEIVAERKNYPSNLPRKTRGRRQAAPNFYDAAHWDELAARHLSRYDLPTWDVPREPEAMRRWLDRLNIPERDYLRATGMRALNEFANLNRGWPLRAWLGTVLEMAHESGR